MVKLQAKVANAIETLKASGVSKSDLIKAANGRYYEQNEVLRAAAKTIEDYCYRNDQNLETVVTAIIEGYEAFTPAEIAAKFSELSTLAYLINLQTSYAAFCDFSGHCNNMRIHIGKGKENKEYSERVYESDTIYLDDLFSDRFDQVKEQLSWFLSNQV